jgi:hypothetical protein
MLRLEETFNLCVIQHMHMMNLYVLLTASAYYVYIRILEGFKVLIFKISKLILKCVFLQLIT